MENNTKKSGKAGYIITIIFLLIVIVILSVLFAFKETIFKTSVQNTCVTDTNTLISNTLENTSTSENLVAQQKAKTIDAVKGYWVSSTNDQFLAITDTTDSLGKTTTTFSLTGSSGITYTDCTIDDTTITCDGKEYKYKMQGNNLILSYDNVTRNFIPSNLYLLSKQSKSYYANMMGYSLTKAQLPQGIQITGDYTNNALVGTWESSDGNTQLVFAAKNGGLVVTRTNKSTRETISEMPVGMTQAYIEFVNNSSLSEEVYQYQLKDSKTLILSEIIGDAFTQYTKTSDEQTPQLLITEQQ
jgi:Tfp pilus assembly protein PilE